MKIPVKLTKNEVISIYGKKVVDQYLTKDASPEEINESIKECGTIIELIPEPTKEQYELAIETYPQVFKKMSISYQTVQNCSLAVEKDISNLLFCSIVDPAIVISALAHPPKESSLRHIVKYVINSDYETLLNKDVFPKFIKAYPQQYVPICETHGRGMISPLLDAKDIEEIVDANMEDILYFEIPIVDPIWKTIAKKNPEFIMKWHKKGRIDVIPYDIVFIMLVAGDEWEILPYLDYTDDNHVNAVKSALFVNPYIIEYIPHEQITADMCMTAILNEPTTISSVPKEHVSSTMVDIALEKEPNLIRYFYQNSLSIKHYVNAIRKNFDNLKYLRADIIPAVMKALFPSMQDHTIEDIIYLHKNKGGLKDIQDIVFDHIDDDDAQWKTSISESSYTDPMKSIAPTTKDDCYHCEEASARPEV